MTLKLLNGTLLGKHWKPFITLPLQEQTDSLLKRLATEELSFSRRPGIQTALSASASSELAAQIFARMCEAQQAILAGGAAPDAWKRLDQLRTLFRSIPVEIAVDGMLQSIPAEFAAGPFRTAVEIFGWFHNETPDLRTELSDGLRQSLRSFLKGGISTVLAEELLDDQTRTSAAVALARAGDAEDLADLHRLIDADLPRGRGRVMDYSNWYLRALLTLEAREVDTVLIDLLREQNMRVGPRIACFSS